MAETETILTKTNEQDNEELVDSYLNSVALLSASTILLYKKVLKSFSDAFKEKSFLTLIPNDIRLYVIGKKESGIWKKANTIASHVQILKSFFRFLVAESKLKEEDNPIKNIKAPPRYVDGEFKALTTEELRTVLKAVESPMIDVRARLIFYIALTTSLRAGEIASIKKSNVDLSSNTIYMPKEDVKGQYRDKVVPIVSKRTRELIEIYYKKYPNNSEYLFTNKFGRKLSYHLIYYAMRDVFDVAYPYKNSWKKPKGAHLARHTFATRWIESFGDPYTLKAIMGWRSFAQFDRYVQVSSSRISKAAQKVENKLLKV